MTRAEFLRQLATVLEWEGDLTERAHLKGADQWDSLGRVDTMMFVDEKLGVTLDFKKLDQVDTIADLIELCGDRVT